MPVLEHAVQFYESESFLLTSVAAYVLEGLRAGESCVVVATPEHRVGIGTQLLAAGVDLAAAHGEGRYIALDAAETLARFTVGGALDATRFTEVIGGIIAAASQGRRVRVFGEMVALLAAAGDHAATIRLEELWGEVQQQQPFTLYCAYPLLHGGEQDEQLLDTVCLQHTRIVPAESYSALPHEDDRLHAIVALQQRAQRLEDEIAERKRIEAELREEHKLIETLYRIGASISAELDLASVVQTVTDAATEVLGAAFGAFFYNVIDERGEAYQLYTLSGVPREAFARFPMPRNTAIFGPTFRGEGVVRLDDVTQDPRYGKNPPYYGTPPGHLPVRSYLAVPVVARSREVLGGLFFGHPQPGVFGARAERIARAIADQAAIAIEHARLFGQEQQARDAAQRALRTRDEFLGSISHDLRTPLTSITGLTQLLLRHAGRAPTVDSARLRASLVQVNEAAARMAAMVDDLLDLTRLESGRPLELRREPDDAVALVRRVVARHRRAKAAHRIEIVADRDTLPVCWDGARMERVIANLLANATTYSPEGGKVTLRLAEERRDNGPWLVLTVQDEGLGIPAGDLPHIFERFHRGANVAGRFKGSGIGLAGAKRTIEQHGGTIAVASNEGEGTRVTIALPSDCPPPDRRSGDNSAR